MAKRTTLTTITPLPITINRETVIRFIHDHDQMITLNPLVIRHEPTTPPANASVEERDNCKWYEITDEIAYLPGGVMKGEVSYKGGFYDLPDGLQTHVFAPAGVDLRGLWKVGGNLPGEPRVPAELGVDVPRDRLYLREDVELRCSIFLSGFVKKNLKKSHGVLVETLVAKASEMQEPPSAAISPDSPLGPHPCFCDGEEHIETCAEYPGAVRPRKAQRLSRLKETGGILAIDTTTVSNSFVPSSAVSGPSTLQTQPRLSLGSRRHVTSDNDSPLWFRPQLYGEQAELPTNDWQDDGLRSGPPNVGRLSSSVTF
nr:hypothetical protein CFP56_21219 [Quercus suber]